MEKLLTLLKRAEGVERDAFHRALLKDHAPRIGAHQPGLAGLIIDLVDIPAEEAGLRPGGEPSFDAIVETWVTADPEHVDGTTLWRDDALSGLVSAAHTYHVAVRVMREVERTWPVGERSPGVKSVYLARRPQDLTPQGYADHWGNTHAPLALKHHVGMWRYIQDVVIRPVSPGAPPWDGFAELHFHTAQDLRERFYDSDEGRAVIAADVARFSSGGRVLHCSEYVLLA